jgi:hypothetical protein
MLSLIGLGLLTGCSLIRTEVGSPLPQEHAPLLEGDTRIETVVDELGPPDKVAALPHGVAFLYEYSRVTEFQIGLSLKVIRLPYFKLVKGDSKISEEAELLIFDADGVLVAYDAQAWKERLGGGGALQWITAVQGLTDTEAFRYVPDQLMWGRASLQSPSVTLNSHNALSYGENGLQQRMSPQFAGQSTLEMEDPKPVRLQRKKTRR